MLGVAYSVRFVWDVFFDGPSKPMPKTPHEPPMWMRLPVEVLVGLVLIVGFLPQVVVGPILLAASEAVLPGAVPEIKLAVWHGFNLPLAMTVVAFGLGVLQFTRRHTLYAWQERFAWSLTSPVAFERFYRGATRFSGAVMALLDARSLQRNLALFFSFLTGRRRLGMGENGTGKRRWRGADRPAHGAACRCGVCGGLRRPRIRCVFDSVPAAQPACWR